MVGGFGNKVVATLRADGTIFPTAGANLMNYKIRTENEIKSLNQLSVPNVVDLGKQLLQYARDGDLKGVKNMLSRGAPFTSDWLGMSALHFAAMNDQFEICEALLRGGINKDSKTKVDRTPLHYACFYGNERVVELLLAKGCAVSPIDMLRMTPLHWAVEKGHKSVVRMLLKRNADVTISSKFDKTPIALAVLTEQADILQELEAARQAQANRKYHEESEKETSEAVNSIMANIVEEPNVMRKMEVDTEDELTSTSTSDIPDFNNIKETGVLDKSAINLLKSHGISMMKDDDDASKDLLTTALKNGRQLVLSEGGKLLLNETKKIQNQLNNFNNNNNNNTFNGNNNMNNNNNTVVPLRVKGEIINSIPQVTKLRTSNIISKAKDNVDAYKNKNIRIISLNDFKKLYGDANVKTMPKLPASLARTRVVKEQPSDVRVRNIENRKTYVNMRQVQRCEVKPQLPETSMQEENLIEEDNETDVDHLANIIDLGPTDSEAEMYESEQSTKVNAPLARPPTYKRIMQLVDVPKVSEIAATAKQQPQQQPPTQPQVQKIMKRTFSSETQPQPQSTVIPLLTVPEICRQLLELRRQNDELKRKFEFAQREKEEMRQRLDRLEEQLLVEKTDDYYAES